jgi:hypothetical protein
MLSEAKLSGTWGWDNWQLSQSGALTYLDETTRLSVGPEIKRHFDVDNSNSIEPFVFFKSSLDLADAGLTKLTAQNTFGGGIALANRDKYKIRASADYTQQSTNTTDPGVTSGKVLVSVPSTLLGF